MSEIKMLFKKLKMPGAYETYEKMGDKSKDEFLQEILKAEIESRNNSTIVKKIKRAGFPTPKDSKN